MANKKEHQSVESDEPKAPQNGSSSKYQQAHLDLRKAEEELAPCDPNYAIDLLTYLLALCGSVGMSTDDRNEWFKAALMTIGYLPRDLLEMACKAAARVCDHPSKIVPFICDDVKGNQPWSETLKWREKKVQKALKVLENFDSSRIERRSSETGQGIDLILQASMRKLREDMERQLSKSTW